MTPPPCLPGLFDQGDEPLFDDVLPAHDISGMVHAGDPHTSIDAAVVIEQRRTELYQKVLAAFARGRMTDEELEELPEFRAYGPSTIRKRRSELYQQGALVVVGECRNSRGRKMLIWDLP